MPARSRAGDLRPLHRHRRRRRGAVLGRRRAGAGAIAGWRERPADPFNDHEPVDSSAAAIAAQGLLRLGAACSAAGDTAAADRYEQAGLRVLDTLFDETAVPEHRPGSSGSAAPLGVPLAEPLGPCAARSDDSSRRVEPVGGLSRARGGALCEAACRERALPRLLRIPDSVNRNRTALVTGGTRGIGLGIARALARDGWALALGGMRPDEEVAAMLDELRRDGHAVDYLRGDISSPDDRARLVATIRAISGACNALVNNAGRAPRVARRPARGLRGQLRGTAAHEPAGAVFPHPGDRTRSGRAAARRSVVRGAHCLHHLGLGGDGLGQPRRVLRQQGRPVDGGPALRRAARRTTAFPSTRCGPASSPPT